MSVTRIKALILQDIFINLRSVEVLIDLPFFSIMGVVAFGFVTKFLTGQTGHVAASYLLLGMIFWEVMRINQYSLTVGTFWSIWARNLTNIFIAPISISEYLVAYILSGLFKTIISINLVAILARVVFGFDIYALGFPNLMIYLVNLLLFSWTLGIFILGIVFKYGSRYAALGWGLMVLFQPLMATFFPLSIMPKILQSIAYTLPPTYVFEAARANLETPAINWNLMVPSLVLNLIYAVLTLLFFHLMFLQSKDSGQFARNEG